MVINSKHTDNNIYIYIIYKQIHVTRLQAEWQTENTRANESFNKNVHELQRITHRENF